MPALKIRVESRTIAIEQNYLGKVPVLLKTGERRYFPWLGFIDLEAAKVLEFKRPVKLDATAFSPETPFRGHWQYLQKGETVQGCLTPEGVYCITLSVMPRIIPRRFPRP